MINIYQPGHATKADAEAEANAIMRQWPPQGYGTSVSVHQSTETGDWTVTGYRWTSCD